MNKKTKISSKSFFIIFISFVLVFGAIFFAIKDQKRKASDITTGAKSAAIHLFHDDININSAAGEARTGYAIPKEVIDNDFTLRISLKAGEYDMLHQTGGNILRIQGNGTDCPGAYNNRNRFVFNHDSSPISYATVRARTGVCTSSEPETVVVGGTQFDAGTRAEHVYDDYFFVYKKPVPGAGGTNGYLRVYRALNENESIIPQGLNTTLPKLEYVIDKDTGMDWLGNDEMFRVIVGDAGNKRLDYGGGNMYGGQDIKVAELTMWSIALDADMALFPEDPTYFAKYYGKQGTFDKYQSPTINGMTHKAMVDLSGIYRNNLVFHYGGTDLGIASDSWKNMVVDPGAGSDLFLTGAGSLTSDVPDWINSNYPLSSRDNPIVENDFLLEKIDNSSLKVFSIPVGTSSGNTTGLELKRILYISTSKENYSYSAVYKKALLPSDQEIIVSNLETDSRSYHVTIEWVDKLENITKKTVSSLVDSFLSSDAPDGSIVFNNSLGYYAQTLPVRLPINKDFTFKINFKLSQLPDSPMKLFWVQDRGNYVYAPLLVTIVNDGGIAKLKITKNDGDKYLYYNTSEYPFTGTDSTVRIGEWEEFWFSFAYPTSTKTGGLYVYRYKPSSASFEVVYNNNKPLPLAWSWFSDWSFKKWETQVHLGGGRWKTNPTSASFLINQVSWWTKSLSIDEIQPIAGMNISKLPRQNRIDDFLFWHLDPKMQTTSVPSLLSADPKLEEKCYIPNVDNSNYLVTDCQIVGDIPAYLNTGDEVRASLSSSYTTYTDMGLPISPTIVNAPNNTTYEWVANSSLNILPNNLTKDITIKSNTVTGAPPNTGHSLTLKVSGGETPALLDTVNTTIYIHKLADINGDNSINFTDFSVLLSSWGTTSNPMANIVRQGLSSTTVDFQDFSVLLSKWGN